MRLHRVLLIAKRDYLAVVLTKGFLFGMLSPVLFGALAFGLVRMMEGGAVKRVAVTDHSGLGVASDLIQMGQMMEAAKKAHPEADRSNTSFAFEVAGDDAKEKVKRNELYAALDVESLDKLTLYTSSGNGGIGFVTLEALVNNGLRRARLARAGIDPARFSQVLIPINLEVQALSAKGPGSPPKSDIVRSLFVPAGMMVIMMMLIMMGSVGMLVGVAEDKKERVFEMLLASATSLEIIAGKILGAVFTSLTGLLVWFCGALLALYSRGLLHVVPMELLPWFLVYLTLNVTMLGALGAALGSAAATPRDAQQLNGILVLPIMMPTMMIIGLMDQPNGTMATAMSFIPPLTPMVMLFRQAMPGGIPLWQPLVGLAGVLCWTMLTTWFASRVFRVGLLMQGKQPSLGTILQWALRG